METAAILGRIKSVHKSHPSIMELFMRELKQIAIVCAAIVAAVSAWADIPNVFDLDLDAQREEAPTVVPTRPPDDPEPVDEPYEPPSLPGSEDVTNRVAEALLFRAWGAVVDNIDLVDENGISVPPRRRRSTGILAILRQTAALISRMSRQIMCGLR